MKAAQLNNCFHLISELPPGILGDELLGLSYHTGEAAVLLSYLNMRRKRRAQSMMMNMKMVTVKNDCVINTKPLPPSCCFPPGW